MSRWTDEELRELITLWPTHSVRQVANRLRRPRWAILSKAKRLRLDGLPPHNPSDRWCRCGQPTKAAATQSRIILPQWCSITSAAWGLKAVSKRVD
jgi:hypothetical protein